MEKIYSICGKEIGTFDGKIFHITEGPNWVNCKNNIYLEGDEGGESYIGTLRSKEVLSMMGETLYTIGEPYSETQ